MRITSKLLRSTVVGALGGFLFGFDTVVISGTTEQLRQVFHLTPTSFAWTMSIALCGTVAGCFIAGPLGQRFGSRNILRGLAVLYILSALGCAFAANWPMLMVARFIGGLGIGGSSVLGPVYIAELAPATWRGRLVGAFQINIVIGILVAYISNWYIAGLGLGANEWRWQLGVAVFPAIIFFVMLFTIPQSSRFLITQDSLDDALAVIKAMGSDRPEAELAEIRASMHREQDAAVEPLFKRTLRLPIFLAVSIGFFNQLSGINAVLYFAPRIFEMTGLGEKAALLQSVGIGIANLVFTFVGLWLIDRLGRRTLLYIGSFGYIISLGLTAWAFFTQHYAIVPVCIFAFIGAHAVGQGAVIWVLISEIFPNRHRAEGQALGSFTHWIFAALLTTFFPKMVTAFAPGYVFAFFAFMMGLQLIWVKTFVPETKGISLEEMQHKLGIDVEPEPVAEPLARMQKV